ncbi:MAG: Holliday junction branch migration protein RuvA [Bacteroidota bacterium]
MIGQLTGRFINKTPTHLVVDINGVGYDVNISLHTFSAISNADSGTLFTFLKITEDAFTLYGFAEQSEKEIFIKLIGVSGVGASTARMMLSSMKPYELQQAITSSNVKLLESIKGIGKKTAERIALELRDKLGILAPGATSLPLQHNTPESEALEGLMALGIGKAVAEQAIKKVTITKTDVQLTVEAIIKLALKSL